MPVGADREEQEEWQVGGLRAGNKDRMDGPHGPSGDNVRDMRFCLSPMLSGFTIFLSGKDLDMVSTRVSAKLLNEVLNEVLLRRPGKK